jgi:hypothetical protein
MYQDVTQWTRIRGRVLRGGISQKQIERETGISRQTLRKMIEFPIPPGYRRKKPADRPKLGPCSGLIDHIIKEDNSKPKKGNNIFDKMIKCYVTLRDGSVAQLAERNRGRSTDAG